jgi:hypothetical protein
MAPEALDGLTSAERHRFFTMLRLCVVVQPEGTLQMSGAFADGQGVCTLVITSQSWGQSTYRGGLTFSATIAGTAKEVRFEQAVLT